MPTAESSLLTKLPAHAFLRKRVHAALTYLKSLLLTCLVASQVQHQLLYPFRAGLQQLQNVTLQQVEAAGDANKRWLEDCMVMLVCVLALDRFGDYGSDQVGPAVSAGHVLVVAVGLAL